MTSQHDFAAYVNAQRSVRALAQRELRRWWAVNGAGDPADVSKALADFMPQLAARYGRVSAVAAADFYETARDDAGVSGDYSAAIFTGAATSYVKATAKTYLTPLADGDMAGALTAALAVVDVAALAPGRQTIQQNSLKDRSFPRWARVPVGKTCAWCVMLAGRGAVYRTAGRAGAETSFHSACDCQAVPAWNGDKDLPPSWHHGDYIALYQRARTHAERNGWNADAQGIMRALRRLDGGRHVTDGVTPPPSPTTATP